MKSEAEHILVKDCDSLQGLTWVVEEKEMMCDLKALLREYYVATFTDDEKALNVSFNNGQKFRITVQDVSKASR